ncbi:hypothetical protein PG999_003653 [Apiospora kogelbergensis]|uniref:Uncharacterized protein n=1 Tax=Apiospora kogelbergensis TaxID=1337665 RepID=A0AAW0R432_9PEZI
MAGKTSATPRSKEAIGSRAGAGARRPSKTRTPVIDLVSDTEDDSMSAPMPPTKILKRRPSEISGSVETDPRPKKRADTIVCAPALGSKSSAVSASSMPNPGNSTTSRLDVAQKQTRLANNKVAELQVKLKAAQSELLDTKNTLSHRDAEVKSYQRQEAELVRTKQLLSSKEAALEAGASQERESAPDYIAGRINELVAENRKISEDLHQTTAVVEAFRASEEELKAHNGFKAERDAAVNELDAAVTLSESRKVHINTLEQSLDKANKSLDRAHSNEHAYIARIHELEKQIHEVESVRDGLESTNEEIMEKLASAEAEIKTAEARKKVANEREKEQIAELLNEIAAVKIQNILLSEEKEHHDEQHNQEALEADRGRDELREIVAKKEKEIKKLEERIEGCAICGKTYEQRLELWRVCEDIRAAFGRTTDA